MTSYRWDIFISHATEDKDSFVRPLAVALQATGLRVWFDEQTLTLGDSLRKRISEGVFRSRFGVVVLSHSFFAKHWPQEELDGLAALEVGGRKVILPVWHGVRFHDVRTFSPLLADRLAVSSGRGLQAVVANISVAVRSASGHEMNAPGPTNAVPDRPKPNSGETNEVVVASSVVGPSDASTPVRASTDLTDRLADHLSDAVTSWAELQRVLVRSGVMTRAQIRAARLDHNYADRFSNCRKWVGFFMRQGPGTGTFFFTWLHRHRQLGGDVASTLTAMGLLDADNPTVSPSQ